MQDMKRLISILSIGAALTLAACQEAVYAPRPAVPLVHSLLQDTSAMGHVVKAYAGERLDGSIAIIGEPSQTLLLAESMLKADFVNNIDGSSTPDALPDFSGETLDLVLDGVYSPYGKYLGKDVDALRTAVVGLSVFAMDSVCRINPFSPENMQHKLRGKVLVYSSTIISEYGQFDVDTLLQLSGIKPYTLSPVQALLEEALIGGDNVNIGVWASPEIASSGIYEAVHGRLGGASTLKVMNSAEEGASNAFRDILGQYRNSGKPLPMHVLLLDGFDMAADELMAEADSIRAGYSEEDMALSKVLAKDFRVIEARDALSRSCYRLMRRENLFTHNISYPKAGFYRTEKDRLGRDVLAVLSERYFTESFLEFMDANTPTVRNFYVPDID